MSIFHRLHVLGMRLWSVDAKTVSNKTKLLSLPFHFTCNTALSITIICVIARPCVMLTHRTKIYLLWFYKKGKQCLIVWLSISCTVARGELHQQRNMKQHALKISCRMQIIRHLKSRKQMRHFDTKIHSIA